MIQVKKKICKGNSKTSGHGCGNLVYLFKYGLCKACFINWATTTPEGNDLIKRTTIKSKKQVLSEDKKEAREKKKELMSKSNYEAILQSIINTIVRLIDIDRGCISCQHGWNEPFRRQRHAGHRYSRGAYPALRFDLFNIFGQCSICNNYLSGNETNYDKGILAHWGQEYLNILEDHKLRFQELKLTIPELQEAIWNATEVKKQLIKGKYFGRDQINSMIGIYK